MKYGKYTDNRYIWYTVGNRFDYMDEHGNEWFNHNPDLQLLKDLGWLPCIVPIYDPKTHKLGDVFNNGISLTHQIVELNFEELHDIAISDWERNMSLTDSFMPRFLEDLIDATSSSSDLPNVDWLDEAYKKKKAVRASHPDGVLAGSPVPLNVTIQDLADHYILDWKAVEDNEIIIEALK